MYNVHCTTTEYTLFSPIFQEYPKLSSAYYSLMDIVTQDHMTLLGNVDPNVIVYILSTLAEGIASVG